MVWSSRADPTTGGAENRLLEAFMVMCPGRDPKDGLRLQMTECAADPRVIKTHLPFSLLPPTVLDTCKVRGKSL